MKFKKLDEDNFLLYAMQYYDNPQCHGTKEFYEDLSRIIYLRRLFKKFLKTGELKDRLIFNHLITFYNVFSIEAATRMLFAKLDKEYYPILKTFLVYLNYIKTNQSYAEWELDMVSIPLEPRVVDQLRKI